MTMRSPISAMLLATFLFPAAITVDTMLSADVVVSDAHARVGRPATPGSVAGVARRTTRRRIRRTSIYIATLPTSCRQVNIEGSVLYDCGGVYYQASGSQYEQVNVD